VKDASRSACDGVPCLRPVPTLIERRSTAFPSLAFLRTSAVTGALSTRGGNRGYRYEPIEVLVPATHREARLFPESQDAFCRHDTRRSFFQELLLFAEGLLPPRLRAGSLAHAAHTFSPGWGECFCWALQVSRCGHPRSVTVPPAGGSRVQVPLLPSESRLGLTTQARRLARPTRPSTGADCPARTDVGRSA